MIRGAACAVALLLAAAPAGAGGVERWELGGAGLAEGEADGVVVAPAEGVSLAPAIRRVLEPEESTLWSVALAPDGWIAAGGGEAGRVYLISPEGTSTVLHEAGQGEVFAVAFAADGDVLAARSPDGAVLRLTRGGGEPEVVFDPGEAYVWDLLPEPDGSLLVATGVPGRVYRVSTSGAPQLLVDPGREQVRSLARGLDGELLFGTGGRATVSRLHEGAAFVLHDAGDGEITDIAVDPGDGAVWVAVVEAGAEEGGGKDDPSPGPPGKKNGKPSPPAGGSLLRIEPDGLVLPVATLAKERPLALVADGPGRVFVGTGDEGRVLMVDREGRVGVRLDTTSKQVHALAGDGQRLVAGLSNVAALIVSGGDPSSRGTLLSPVRDAGRAARWGRIRIDGERPRGARLDVEVRGGNTAEPDAGWSGWTAVGSDPLAADGVETGLGPSRFMQWRLVLAPGRQAGPVARSVTLRYRPANRPPRITSLQLEPAGLAYRALPSSSAASGEQSVLTDPVPREVQEKLGGNGRGQSRSKKAFEPGVRTAVWEADDPDGDRLLFDLWVGSESGDGWLPLARDVDDTFHAFDTRVLPDGRYRLKLVAGDGQDNDPSSQRASESISDPFLVDNRAPEIAGIAAVPEGDGSVRITFVGRDATGPVVAAEISVNGGAWRTVLPDDRVGDAREERFSAVVPVSARAPGPIRVRVVDEAGNIGTAEVPAQRR